MDTRIDGMQPRLERSEGGELLLFVLFLLTLLYLSVFFSFIVFTVELENLVFAALRQRQRSPH